MAWFRFQDLEIWQMAIRIADELFNISEELDRKRLYRFAEQLRGAGMSMSENIAERSRIKFKKGIPPILEYSRKIHFRKRQYPNSSKEAELDNRGCS